MLSISKQRWSELRDTLPGNRFQAHYERSHRSLRKNRLAQLVAAAGGILIMLFGVVLFFTPGPGIVFVFLGASLLASRSLRLAQLFDRWELGIRNRVFLSVRRILTPRKARK